MSPLLFVLFSFGFVRFVSFGFALIGSVPVLPFLVVQHFATLSF